MTFRDLVLSVVAPEFVGKTIRKVTTEVFVSDAEVAQNSSVDYRTVAQKKICDIISKREIEDGSVELTSRYDSNYMGTNYGITYYKIRPL